MTSTGSSTPVAAATVPSSTTADCAVPPSSGHPGATAYASWARRLAAGLLDRVLDLLAVALLTAGYARALLAAARDRALAPTWAAGADQLAAGTAVAVVALLGGIANRWWWQGRTGRSLGKRVLGSALLGESTGAPVGPAHAALRDLVHALDTLTLVGYLWPLWDRRRQTLADKLTGTVVVVRPRS